MTEGTESTVRSLEDSLTHWCSIHGTRGAVRASRVSRDSAGPPVDITNAPTIEHAAATRYDVR